MKRFIAISCLAATVVAAQEKTPDSRLRNATAAMQEIMKAPDKGIPQDLLDKAYCAVVVPDLLKAAFIVGGKYGRGFASCRTPHGWSAPAAMRIEGGSFGFQLGGQSTDLVMLIMNQRGMDRLMSTKFTIGGEASAAAGPVGRLTSAQTDLAMHAEILAWSRARGLFAGVSLDGATLRSDDGENQKLYGREVPEREILEGKDATPPAARPFVAMLNRIAPGPKTGTPRTETTKNEPSDKLRQPGGRITLTDKEVHFDTGKADVPKGAEPALQDIVVAMRDNPGWKIRVEGFTDNVGSKELNQQLSQQRAESVANWLTDHGVDKSRVSAKGYGDSRPAADNSTPDGRAKNRRVELVRTDNVTG
jgi:lipid-binding SYLF domain-containing protein